MKAGPARKPKHVEGFVTIITDDGHVLEEQTYAEGIAAGDMAPHTVVPRPSARARK